MTDTLQSYPARTGSGDGTIAGVCDAVFLNAIRSDLLTKGDRVGRMMVSAVAPTGSDGVNGEYWWNTATLLLHKKTSGAWDAGTAFGLSAYQTWVANGGSYNGGTTEADFLLDIQGEPGDSRNFYAASTEPADADKEEGALYAIYGSPVPTSKATAGGVTYTAAEILSDIIVRDCAGSGRTDTLPSAALLVAAIETPYVNQMLSCLIVNGSDAAETITIAAGSGGTWDTNQTTASRVIPQNASKRVHIRITNIDSGTEAYKVYL